MERSLFDSFNARFLRPSQVAQRFVIPSHFEQVRSRTHSVIIGPRGSGKTTLLKMLQLSALREWSSNMREEVAREIDFTAVYIAADTSWSSLFESVGDFEFPTDLRPIVAAALFNTYLQYAFLDALEEISDQRLRDDRDLKRFYTGRHKLEPALCSALADQWLLSGHTPSFFILRSKLGQRLNAIAALAEDIRFKVVQTVADIREKHKFVDQRFELLLKSTVDTINSCIGHRERKWCVCIDELEIVPSNLRQMVFRSLRSIDQRLLLKVSLSPFSIDLFENSDTAMPMPGQDYNPIYLSYPNSSAAMRFGRELARSLLVDTGLPDVALERIFGHSDEAAAEPSERPLSAYSAPSGERFKLFDSLQKRDASFRSFLKQRHYDINNMPAMRELERAQLRKLLQICRARLEFRSFAIEPKEAGAYKRSRKRIHSMYTGLEALLTICEGNPRWVIGILHPLIRHYKIQVDLHSNLTRIDRARQARQILRVITRYRALLSTIPFTTIRSDWKSSVLPIIDKIGTYMFQDVVLGVFKPEPVLSFIVDRRVNEAQVLALGTAINQGAFVLVPNRKGETTYGSIRNSRFRMSYLLAPDFQLPLTYGAQINLSSILSTGGEQIAMDQI